MPILLILGAMIVVIGAMYFYEWKWGAEGPFQSHHHHEPGSLEEKMEEHELQHP